MRDSDKEYYIVGLRKKMEELGLRQVGFAKLLGLNPVTINRYFKGKSFPDERSLILIRSALKMTEDDIIALSSPRPVITLPAPPPPTLPTDYLSADDVVQAMSSVSASFIKLDSRLKYWSQMLEFLPVSVMVIRDGIIYSQNRKSRAMWNGLGKRLCDGCVDEKCREYGCDIEGAINTGADVVKFKQLGDDFFKIETGHFSANNHNYSVVVATEVNKCHKDAVELEEMRKEREFFAQSPTEPPKYYANADRKVTYVNRQFLELFKIKREDIQTTDDFHIIISKRLFYFGHVSSAADEVRQLQKPAEVAAKLSNNKPVYFIFRPHIEDGVLIGVMVIVLTPELFEYYQVKTGEEDGRKS